ncbi:MAG: YhgE/Pip domain-containing protein [Bacillota bacterium]|nr:YhgE/Pip domain-containing protein [Bacillota bacterium]
MKLNKNKSKSKKVTLVIAIIFVMFIPMLYSSIYLGSIWNVYGSLDSVPVAFVNLDKSVTKDGKQYSLGKELEDNLKTNKDIGWKFVSYEDAMDGVRGTKYYAVIEIPENFSENISNTQDGKLKTPEIIYIGNQGENFVFSQVSSKIASSIKAKVSSSIQKELSKALVDSLDNMKVSIKDAADGAAQLQSGEHKLLNGGKELADGTQRAADGSAQLESGLKTAANSTTVLQAGTQKLVNGSNNLSNGLNIASAGSKRLQAGLKGISIGEEQVVSGSSTLVDGLKTLKSNLTKPNDQISQLVKGASNLNNNADAITQGTGQLDTSVSTLASAVNDADSYLHDTTLSDEQKLNAAMLILDHISRESVGTNGESRLTIASNSIHQLSDSLQQLKKGTQKISDGVGSLAAGLADTQSKAAAGTDQLIGGAQEIQEGSGSILTALNTVTNKTEDLANGLDELNSGSTSLQEGLKTINDGNMLLVKGLNTAAEKTDELSNGLKSLSNGSNFLKDGLQNANAGVAKLSDGLNDGYDKIDSKLKFNSKDMSQFISEPITLKDNSINNVKYYGEGLAPYFLSLSLWLGAMFFNMILAKVKPTAEIRFINCFMGKFIAGSIIVAFQALILSITAINGLGVKPVSVPQFYLTNVLISIVFFSVIYGLSYALGAIGRIIIFLVFIMQLASSAGTFPIETAPTVYRIINKIVPMTYSVSTLRMTISGINQSILNHYILVMFIFIIVFLCGGFITRAAINLGKEKEQSVQDAEAA